jgi:hypothetical protein
MIMISVLEKQYMETVIRMGRRLNSGEIDWEQRRYEIAKDMMAAIMNNPDIAAGVACEPEPREDIPATLAKLSLTFADALMAELKKNPVKE